MSALTRSIALPVAALVLLSLSGTGFAAEAVRKALSALGAQIERMESISNGEEKPRATGHDEGSYAENRRADMVYDGE